MFLMFFFCLFFYKVYTFKVLKRVCIFLEKAYLKNNLDIACILIHLKENFLAFLKCKQSEVHHEKTCFLNMRKKKVQIRCT